MNATGHADEKYYQAVPPRSLGERLTIAARDRIYADFIRCCAPGADDAILDVGVSDVVNDAANMLERNYPHPGKITALGLGHGGDFRAAFPSTSYVRIAANQSLPFADKSFAIATSNAVSEMVRVARKVFISVPHRYFPVEHHTAIPLLHFWDRTFAPACRVLGKSEWADEKNLILMSKRRLKSLGPPGAVIALTGLWLGSFSSNLMLFVDGDRNGAAMANGGR
jgi:hypothetical protein